MTALLDDFPEDLDVSLFDASGGVVEHVDKVTEGGVHVSCHELDETVHGPLAEPR